MPTSLLPVNNDNKYVYLWSQFGLPSLYGNTDYEERAYLHYGGDCAFGMSAISALQLVAAPEPATLIVLGTGLLLGGGAIRRRNRRQASQE